MRRIDRTPIVALKFGLFGKYRKQSGNTRERMRAKMIDFASREAQFKRAGFHPCYLTVTFLDDMGNPGQEQGLRRIPILWPTPVFRLARGWYEHHFDTPYV